MKFGIGFVGPLPPPLGGVAVINQNLQRIDYRFGQVLAFDTSSGGLRENLYGHIGLRSVCRNLGLLSRIISFMYSSRPDVVNLFVTSGRSVIRDVVFLLVIKTYRVPVIVHFHSKTEGEFALKPWRLRVLSVIFHLLSSKVLVMSDFHYNFFAKYFGRNRCAVLENFVRYEDFSCSIEGKTDRFLYVGRLTREKGFFDVLEALRYVRESKVTVDLDVIGVAQSEEDELRIEGLISDFGIGHMVHLYGARTGVDKFALFKQAKCLVFPSHFENSPVVLKEAIAAKMAIIASDIPANENILQGLGNSLFFKRGSPERLAARILEVSGAPESVRRMCEASARVEKFDEPLARRKMLEVIAEVTNGRA